MKYDIKTQYYLYESKTHKKHTHTHPLKKRAWECDTFPSKWDALGSVQTTKKRKKWTKALRESVYK